MELNVIQEMVKEPYERLGFRGQWDIVELKEYLFNCGLSLTDELGKILGGINVLMDISEIGLFSEENGELLDAVRNDCPLTVSEKTKDITSIGEECADIVIRVMNFCNRKGINLESEIMKKHKYNMNREFLHGKNS